MFSCFSKKKKPILPSRLQEKQTEQSTTILHDSPLETPPCTNTLAASKSIKKSKFCPIAHDPKSSSLMAIDQMLEEELKDGTLPMQEGTAKFMPIQEEVSPQSHANYLEKDIIHEQTPQSRQSQSFLKTPFSNTKSISFDVQGDIEDDGDHMIPRMTLGDLHTLEELTEVTSTKKHRRRTKKNIKKSSPVSTAQQFDGYDANLQQWALQTTITLQNFKLASQRIQGKISEQLQDLDLMDQTLQQAQNSFYCGNLSEQLTRAIVSSPAPDLAKRIFAKMNLKQKNTVDSKGYTPVQLLVLKAISNPAFMQAAKQSIHDPQVALDCRGPTGWTPLQEALFYRNIPLATHLFRASYAKRQQQIQTTLRTFADTLKQLPDFRLELQVKVDSFLPLVGSLAPSDTLILIKCKDRLSLKYTLVGYEFPSCKRRNMELQFDGSTLWAINHSKSIYCDLLEGLEQQQMILMIEDMLAGEMRRGWPIVHSASLTPSLSLFQNPITESIAGAKAAKHALLLCYTSTAEKRRSQIRPSTQLGFLNDLKQFKQRRDSVNIKEKNRNKRVELEVWLAQSKFGLELGQLLQMLQVLGMGNNFIGEWSKFLNDDVGRLIRQTGRFPLKIDIPLNYSLFFNIQFKSFSPVLQVDPISLPDNASKIQRKQFQGTLQNREKRALFIKAYT